MRRLLIPVIIILMSTFFINAGSAQEKLNFSLGISNPEGYNFGIRYKYKLDRRLDFIYGNSIPFESGNNWNAFTLNHAIYFGKPNKHDSKKWSLNTGFTLGLTNETNSQNITGFINLFLAREMFISNKIFVEPQVGASYLLFYEVNKGIINGYVIKFMPKLGINIGLKI